MVRIYPQRGGGQTASQQGLGEGGEGRVRIWQLRKKNCEKKGGKKLTRKPLTEQSAAWKKWLQEAGRTDHLNVCNPVAVTIQKVLGVSCWILSNPLQFWESDKWLLLLFV